MISVRHELFSYLVAAMAVVDFAGANAGAG